MGDAVDYIIEEGSNEAAHESDQQRYMVRWTKYASGRLSAVVSDYFNGGRGTLYKSQYYLQKVLELPHTDDEKAPAFIEPPFVLMQARASSGWTGVQIHTITPDKVGFWVYGTRRDIPRFSVDVILEGCWK